MYATGSASTPSALLAALETFAVSAGWTVSRSQSAGVPPGGASNDLWTSLVKGGCHLNFNYIDSSSIYVNYLADGFNGSAAPGAQSSITQANASYMNPGRAPYTAYFFFSSTSGTYLHVVLEWEASVYTHLHGGLLNAQGGASPCMYSASTAWSYGGSQESYPDAGVNIAPFSMVANNNATQVFLTVDGTKAYFQQPYGPGLRLITAMRTGGLQQRGVMRTPNTFNELTVLYPCHFAVERATTGVYSYIGEAPDIRVCNIANVNPQDEVTLGSDVWKYFPVTAKTPPSTWNGFNNGIISSGNYGIALKKSA